MSKSLVIVESPAKAKTINKYLGPGFVVRSSVGHIRDLPKGGGSKTVNTKLRAAEAAKTRKMKPEEKAAYKKSKARKQLITRMGINPDRGWEARYEILPNKEKVVSELKKLAKISDKIYLATDLDREGEAIAWHLQEAIGGNPERYQRVVFNEITKSAINEAFANPGRLDMRYVEAQQARRFLDRVVGYMVSPLLWAKVARGLSAGRVQSVAVRLVVEREAEIRAFIPEEFWEVFCNLTTAQGDQLRCQVLKWNGDRFRPTSRQETDQAMAILDHAEYRVQERKDKPTTSNPKPPLITSTLQQAASTRLGYGVKKTMMMAQQLYEAGYITYMRTDSTHLSGDAITMCRKFIGDNFGADYLPDKPRYYTSQAGAQEAHEAIRPTDVRLESGQLVGMESEAVRLYGLIWCFFVACQMPPARFLSSTIVITADEERTLSERDNSSRFDLQIKGRIMQFDGYQKVLPTKDEDVVLPPVEKSESLQLRKMEPFQNFTKPPPRYTEASLVRELEKRKIGRPSTYAAIISTIQERGYVTVENKRFFAQRIGDIVAERLLESFSDLMDYDFTARMEDSLDKVAAGDIDWRGLLDNFYRDFVAQLDKAESGMGGMRANDPTNTDIKCSKCSRSMQIRTASTGVFLGCSGYSLSPKERCKNTINLTPGEEAIRSDTAEEAEKQENIQLRQKQRCSLCGTAMDSYLIDEKRKLHVCGRNPDCPGFEVEVGLYKIKGYDGPIIECDKCGSEMQLKSGRFGKYFGCTNIECKNTRKLLRNGQPAPPKMDPVPMPELPCLKVEDHYILRDGAAGLFLAASKFPKHRETRAPLVEELLRHKEEIDPKYAFLFSAPVEDKAGNKAQVRFSRKTGEQYVLTEADGKATGWKAFFRDGNWQVVESAKGVPQKQKRKSRSKRNFTAKKKVA